MAISDSDARIIIIVFSVVCFVLFLICLFLCVAVGFIISKLKHHDKAIAEMETREHKIIHHSKENTTDIETTEDGYNEMAPVLNTGERPSNDGHLRRTKRRTGSYHPRMEVVIEKETVNVYGNKAPTGQLMSIAQNYYKEENRIDTNVPAESIDILDKAANTRLGKSMIFSNDWMSGGVPTSLLFDGGKQHIENIATQNKGIFIHKTVGPEGNTLTISGVKLTIPQNAIREHTLISVGILWDEKFVPKLRKRETLLSPLVLCQPSSLTFEKPVTLSFPHAAVDVKDDWRTKLIKREGNLTTNSNWSQLTEFDCSAIFVNSDKIELKLNHFTTYTYVGESNIGKVAKKMFEL